MGLRAGVLLAVLAACAFGAAAADVATGGRKLLHRCPQNHAHGRENERDTCVCSAGHERRDGECHPCHQGFRKAIAGDFKCEQGDQQHVILLSFDGLHARDLAFYLKHNPGGNLAQLAAEGTIYKHARTTGPSDSVPGVLSMTTAGTPTSTGMYYDKTFGRDLFMPNNSACTGTPGFVYSIDEGLEFDNTKVDGGKPGADTVSRQKQGLNPDLIPYGKDRNGNCVKIYPSQRVRVNTIFDAAKKAGGYTAWCDKGLAYQLLQGRTGNGIDDLFTPEVKGVPYDTNNPPTIIDYDQTHTTAIVNWIGGRNTAGQSIPIPTIMGGDYQHVSVSQKVPGFGYSPPTIPGGEPQPTQNLIKAFDFIDNEVGQIMDALREAGIYETTTMFITAKHGQSPRDPTKLVTLTAPNGYPGSTNMTRTVLAPSAVVAKALPGEPAWAAEDDVSFIWLFNQDNTERAVAALQAQKGAIGAREFLYRGHGIERYNDPRRDIRVPDIVIISEPGVIYTKSKGKIAEHGGFVADDRNVALLAAGPLFPRGEVSRERADTTQIAVSIMEILGQDPEQLDAVRIEGTTALPGMLR